MKLFIKYLKKLFALYIVGSSNDKKHDCLKNKQLIEEYPLYHNPYGILFGKPHNVNTGYKYRCKVCDMDWHE